MGFLGIRYANKLKLWDFDYDKTYQRVMDILAGAKAETIPLNENDTQILGEYLISRGPNTITINSKIDKRVENTFNDDDKREAVGEPDMIPKSSIIYVRQEPDTRFIFINRRDFVEFLKGRVSANAMVARLKEMGYVIADKVSKRLGKGYISTTPVSSIQLNMDKVLGKDAPK
jgi:hypothetical protein